MDIKVQVPNPRNRKRKRRHMPEWARGLNRQQYIEALRLSQLMKNVGDIFSEANSILNIGAYKERFHFLENIKNSNARRKDVLEIDTERCNWLKACTWINRVYCGDVVDIDAICKKTYDLVLWSHGPALLDKKDVAPTIKKLEKIGNLIVIMTPYGEYNYKPESDLSVIDYNRTAMFPEDFIALGYETHTIGRMGAGPTANLLAWKRIV